jgi:hypothetical protein
MANRVAAVRLTVALSGGRTAAFDGFKWAAPTAVDARYLEVVADRNSIGPAMGDPLHVIAGRLQAAGFKVVITTETNRLSSRAEAAANLDVY